MLQFNVSCYVLSFTGQLEDKVDTASGPRMAVWQFKERRAGSVPVQLRGDQGSST